jgi:hypothetical protein
MVILPAFALFAQEWRESGALAARRSRPIRIGSGTAAAVRAVASPEK